MTISYFYPMLYSMKQKKSGKTLQLQIRVSPEEKLLIVQSAKREGLDVSSWVLKRSLNSFQDKFKSLVGKLSQSANHKYEFSELNEFISNLASEQSELAFSEKPKVHLSSYEWNYIAAMIEYSAYMKVFRLPDWINEIEVLEDAVFETNLESLKLYLLTQSPIPFRRRNIFIDTSIGGQV